MALYYAQSEFSAAEVVILGLPYDRTSSFVPGSRFGPPHIRIAADNIESYSPRLADDLTRLKIHDAGDVAFPAMTWAAVAQEISLSAERLFEAGKLPVFLGGEHSVSVPVIAAAHKFHPDLAVIQFDAHADLREELLGEAHSHATAMFHAGTIVGAENVYQFGIRSGTADEFRKGANLFSFAVREPLKSCCPTLSGRPLYLTIDIDVLDPSVMPAVATPEPGGIDYYELLSALTELRGYRLIGADIVEYNPLANRDLASASVAAALLREVILIVAGKNPKERR